ncbi:hypothetical protein XH88_05595 [Bradyrhizobium sp. CCBAU 51627]|nr:hypothetical protein [Bradyrhizobium sp. CCBAU 51627]
MAFVSRAKVLLSCNAKSVELLKQPSRISKARSSGYEVAIELECPQERRRVMKSLSAAEMFLGLTISGTVVLIGSNAAALFFLLG